MADQDNKLDWWGKPDHLKEPSAAKGAKGTTKGTTKGAAKGQTKERTKEPKKVKRPLSKVEIALRICKHGSIMLAIILLGAIGAHYTLTGITRHGIQCTVPDFEDLTMVEARAVAERDDLSLIVNDSLYAPNHRRGVILDQLPKAGMVVKPGRTIYLTVNATERQMVDIPYVAERSLRQGKNMLDMAGLSIKELIYEDDLAENYILEQYIDQKVVTAKSNERVAVGSEITLHVGRGSINATLTPMVMGLTLRDAKSALWSAGLNVGEVSLDEDVEAQNELKARVYAQSQRAEERLRLGDRIDLSITTSQIKVDTMVVNYYKMLEEERKMLEEIELMEMYDGEYEMLEEEKYGDDEQVEGETEESNNDIEDEL